MAHRASVSCGGATRRVAALVVGVGLAATSFIVPWFAPAAGASTPVVTNYTGTGISNPYGITAGPDGNMWFATPGAIGRITTGICIATDATPCLSPRQDVILSEPRSRTPITISTRPQ